MISNSGKDENGNTHGGKAGDQGGEWTIRSWYNRPWNCILRHPDAKVRAKIAELGEKAANNNKIGYDQWQRNTYWEQLKKAGYDPSKITTACEADCSAGVIANVKAVGHLLNIDKLKKLDATYTGNMRTGFKKAGFSVLTASKYLTSDKYLLRGDILLNDKYHTATNLTNGSGTRTNTGCPYAEPYYYISRGSTGNGTKWVQWHLKRLGYDIGSYGIDGICGRMTDAAIRKFQRDKKLEVDGIVGPLTRKELKK